jgi:hypothetical protein
MDEAPAQAPQAPALLQVSVPSLQTPQAFVDVGTQATQLPPEQTGVAPVHDCTAEVDTRSGPHSATLVELSHAIWPGATPWQEGTMG